MVEKHRDRIIAGVVGGLVLILLIVACMILGKQENKEFTGEEGVTHAALTYDNVESIKCRLELHEVGVYEIGMIEGTPYVFKDGDLKGKSTYSIVASNIREYGAEAVELSDTELEECKDSDIKGLYHLENEVAVAYINSLKEDEYIEKARVYMDTYVEGILENEEHTLRYIIANDSLMIKDIEPEENKFGSDYFIDKYIY